MKNKKDNIPAEEYRKPMLILNYRVYIEGGKEECYPECPRCEKPTERDYQKYCSHCGQRLKWNYSKMKKKIK